MNGQIGKSERMSHDGVQGDGFGQLVGLVFAGDYLAKHRTQPIRAEQLSFAINGVAERNAHMVQDFAARDARGEVRGSDDRRYVRKKDKAVHIEVFRHRHLREGRIEVPIAVEHELPGSGPQEKQRGTHTP